MPSEELPSCSVRVRKDCRQVSTLKPKRKISKKKRAICSSAKRVRGCEYEAVSVKREDKNENNKGLRIKLRTVNRSRQHETQYL